MKKVLFLGVTVLVLSSCMHSLCPTYSGAKGYSAAATTVKKQKESNKNKTPYYKVTKQAEQD